MKRFMLILLAAALALYSLAGCESVVPDNYGNKSDETAPSPAYEYAIYSSDGEKMTNAENGGYADEGYSSYCSIALDEASGILASIENISVSEASEKLLSNDYSIYTCFDRSAYESIRDAHDYYIVGGINFASAVTDNSGKLLAAFSHPASDDDKTNYAAEKTKPYSSIKPLSVYAPALENKIINWSTMVVDSPVKKVDNGTGGEKDWPTNASGTYELGGVPIWRAVEVSLNTVAVKVLLELTPEKSLDFLKNTLGVDVDYEEYIASSPEGEDNILANIGLGYLYSGISPVDMAGYYTIFANGGLYTKPYAVESIVRADGKTVYEASFEGERVISEETSAIMREMLKLVVSKDGTGADAASCGLDVGGKTGTGTDYAGNWFVGFTPEYTMSVWYGSGRTLNICPKIFAMAASSYTPELTSAYPECLGVCSAAFCPESGGLLSDGCRDMEVGLFTEDNMPPECDIH